MPRPKILVVGGGLCGLACVIACRLADCEVIVFERMEVLQEIGAGIQLPPNATRILHAWGILERIATKASEPRHIAMRTESGELLTEISTSGPKMPQHLTTYLLIHRADLLSILLDRAKELGAEIRLGAEVTKISSHSLTLATGEEVHGSLILGADGERSTCRERILQKSDPLMSSGDTVYRAAVPVSQLAGSPRVQELVEPSHINYWIGSEAHAVSYVTSTDGLLNIAATCTQTEKPVPGMQYIDATEMLEQFKGWDERLTQAIALSQRAAKWTLFLSNENEHWSDGKRGLLLVGDAAHAMLPYLAQGAAQGFEDAAVLGMLLSRHDDMRKVMWEFERLRKERAMKVLRESKDVRRIFALPAGEEQRQRNQELAKGVYRGSKIKLTDLSFQLWLWEGGPGQELESRVTSL